jgi:hypothetical protein
MVVDRSTSEDRAMKRKVCGAIIGMGLLLGSVIALLWPARVVDAQTSWQCRSWTLEEKADATPVGTWLGQAKTVQLTAAGLSAGSRFAVVACKQ